MDFATRSAQAAIFAFAALLVFIPSARADDEPIFTDRSAELGLDFVHFNGMSGELYFVEMTGGGGALVDYDGDGDLDVYFSQGRMLGEGEKVEESVFPPHHPEPFTDRLYRNDLVPGGELRFEDVTASSGLEATTGYGMGVAAGDVDNDSFPDLYLANFGPNQLLKNKGGKGFEDVTASAGAALGDERWSVSAAFLDYDRDGWLDLYVVNYVDFRLATHKTCASDVGARDYCGPNAYPPVNDRLLRNLGPGEDGRVRFEDASELSGIGRTAGPGLGVVAADFNGDGWLDLYVANDGAANFLWLNQGDGTFVDEALLGGAAVNAEGQPEASMGLVAGDVDGDGDEDLFMSHLARESNTLYLNDGRGLFRDSTQMSGLKNASFRFTGFGTVLFDFDNDGWQDLFVANGAVTLVEELLRRGDPYPLHETNQLFRNLGGGARFEEVTPRAGAALEHSEVSRGLAAGDVDNDGDVDLLVINNAGPARLLINEVGQDRPWIGLRLVTPEGRNVLGARVEIRRKDAPTLYRRVATDGSFASASDPRLTVGLGETTQIEELRVTWPDGSNEVFPAPPLGRYTTLVKGQGAVVEGQGTTPAPEP